MATVSDLGAKVKAKYPGQYDDLSDEDVGRKVRARFPGQYDDFEDAPAPPKVGMGDVQASPSSWVGSSNVPVGLLTGDEATDNQIGQNLAAHGARKAITKGDVGRTAAGIASVAAPFLIPEALAGAAVGGGFGGLATTDAETVPGMVWDAAKNAFVAASGAKVLQLAGPYVSKVAEPVRKWLAEKSLESGRKALSGIGTSLSARKEIPAAAVEQAYASGAIQPFSTVKGIAGRLEATADEVGGRYAAILADLERQGVKGPNAQLLARKLADQATQAEANSLGSSTPGFLRDRADELVTKVTPDANRDLGLMQAEKMKRQLQSEARREYDKLQGQYTTSGQNKVDLAATMRGAIEDSVQEQASLAPESAAQFEPVKQELSSTLQALTPAWEGAARAARRKGIGLTDTIVGASTGNPLTGIPAALLHGFMDRRLASTAGYATRQAAQGLGALAESDLSPVVAQSGAIVSPELRAWLEQLRLRGGGPGLVPVGADEQQ
jgi:hypothetical protein